MQKYMSVMFINTVHGTLNTKGVKGFVPHTKHKNLVRIIKPVHGCLIR
tara:strand:- start:4972 stop:5115 length:144 start_codon:yes stop_codon:yes gene_type:complete